MNMIQTVNFPLCKEQFNEYKDYGELQAELASFGLSGIEGIWGGEDISSDIPEGLVAGYHLSFHANWVDFYKGDKDRLNMIFGSVKNAESVYGGPLGPETILNFYRDDIIRAKKLKPKYMVFHVTDVSLRENFTYERLHTNLEVIECAAGLINELLKAEPIDCDFLMENQWWPGFTMTEPAETERLLELVEYENKGILVDTGHLLNCNPGLRTQKEGIAFIKECFERHGGLCNFIKGFHLHQGLSGAYVKKSAGKLPENWPEDFYEQFNITYPHIKRIDMHKPWTNPEIAGIIQSVNPKYLTHELAAVNRKKRQSMLSRQITTLRNGGLSLEK